MKSAEAPFADEKARIGDSASVRGVEALFFFFFFPNFFFFLDPFRAVNERSMKTQPPFFSFFSPFNSPSLSIKRKRKEK